MNTPTKLSCIAVLLAALAACAQEESTNSGTGSARYWTSPRVEQEPASLVTEIKKRPAGSKAEILSIDNETLEVKWNSGTERFTIASKLSHRIFLADGSVNANGDETAKISAASHKVFGTGKAIEISRANGDRDVIMLFPQLPFALIQSSLRNGGATPAVTRRVRPFQGIVDLGKPVANLKSLGTGGLADAGDDPGSYDWLAVAEPQSRNGVVFGWLTHDRGDGVWFSKTDGNKLRVGGQIDYGRLRIAAGESAELEMLAVGYFDDARLGLEQWADAVAKVYDIHLPPQPTVYCTWYSQPYGAASDEEHLIQNAEFAKKNFAPFGFSVIQIDDHWQAGISTNGPHRDFLNHASDGPYPHGMKPAAHRVQSLGLRPGIWFLPFAGTYYDPAFKDHPDWFVKHEDGSPYETKWGGTCLDMTEPGAREHLRQVVSRITHDWGFQYLKIDGLWTGSATPLRYVNTSYVNDNIGDAVFHDPNKSNLEAYRDGLKLVREAAGRNVFILGCNGPQNMRSYGGAFGLVDGMRIGPDNRPDWRSLLRGPTFGSRHYFLNKRIWYNDPDPVYIRQSVSLNHARLICSWVTIAGDLNTSSEWYPGLPPDRVDLLKRTMPSHNLMPRPADLFDSDLPSLWLLTQPPTLAADNKPRRDVIGVFNWDSNEKKFDYPLDKLGLDANTQYVAFDYWQNVLVPAMKGRLQISVPGESCCALAVRPAADHPQLLSTSRHITQGIVDVLEEKWDPATKTLGGRSKVVAGDPYELRIVTPDKTWIATDAQAMQGRSKIKVTQTDDLVRATISPAASGEVVWSVKFK